MKPIKGSWRDIDFLVRRGLVLGTGANPFLGKVTGASD